jgi:hypothetical protein
MDQFARVKSFEFDTRDVWLRMVIFYTRFECSFTSSPPVSSVFSQGKLFDKGSIEFVLGRGEVIKGWEIGAMGMEVGELSTRFECSFTSFPLVSSVVFR